MPEIIHLRALLGLLRDHVARLHRKDPEAGLTTIETAIIAGLLALAAAGLAALLVSKINQKSALIRGA
jgi:hypothetical protein